MQVDFRDNSPHFQNLVNFGPHVQNVSSSTILKILLQGHQHK
jgi:hypothetical protein